MNIFAHFKDIDSQCTQETIHTKLFLLIINQFHCYYHRRDHYSQRTIERVVMNFFKTLLHADEGHDFLSVLTYCIIVLSIEICNV